MRRALAHKWKSAELHLRRVAPRSPDEIGEHSLDIDRIIVGATSTSIDQNDPVVDRTSPMKRSLALARQGRRPTGLLGHVVARIMAIETRAANLVALEALELDPDDRLLEVGSGHGRTLAAAARIVTRGRLAGVDPSEVMQAIARRRNARAIHAGRMTLALGSSDQLPFDGSTFNKALAVHTVYFWDHPERDLLELRRVLEPGGRLVLAYRPAEDPGFVQSFPKEIYRIRSSGEIETLLRNAGFPEIETLSRPVGPGTMCWTSAC